MSKKCTVISDQSGFSLISVSLFIMALSLLSAAGLQLYSQYDKSRRAITTQDQLTRLRAALIDYYGHHGRFPCAASRTAAPGSNRFAVEAASPCTSHASGTGTERASTLLGLRMRIGSVPTRALNLPDSYLVDGYGHRITYVVEERMASPGATLAPLPGIIAIQDRSGHNATRNRAIALLISHGGDARGAYSVDGILIEECDRNVTSGENCDDDEYFVNTLSKSDRNDASHFTHRVVYITPDMIGR